MRPVEHIINVSTVVNVDHKDVSLLKDLAEHHYCSRVKALAKENGILDMLQHAATSTGDYILTHRELDTLTKATEMSPYMDNRNKTTDYTLLSRKLHGIMHELQAQQKILNQHRITYAEATEAPEAPEAPEAEAMAQLVRIPTKPTRKKKKKPAYAYTFAVFFHDRTADTMKVYADTFVEARSRTPSMLSKSYPDNIPTGFEFSKRERERNSKPTHGKPTG